MQDTSVRTSAGSGRPVLVPWVCLHGTKSGSLVVATVVGGAWYGNGESLMDTTQMHPKGAQTGWTLFRIRQRRDTSQPFICQDTDHNTAFYSCTKAFSNPCGSIFQNSKNGWLCSGMHNSKKKQQKQLGTA